MFWGFGSCVCPASCASLLSLLFGQGGYSKAAAKLCVGDFDAQELANTAWAFATASQSDALVFAVLAKAAKLCVGDFDAQELANTAWAFATASQSDSPLFAVLAKAAELCVGDFDAQELANTAWAFATAS